MRYKWLPIATAVFIIIAMTIQFVVSYRWEKNRVIEHIDYEILLAKKDFVFEIYDIQDAGEEMVDYVKHHLDKPEKIYRETGIVLKRYPDVLSCYVSFRPGYYDDDDYWYCPCAFRKGDSIVQEMYGDVEHDYFQSRWYQRAIENKSNGYWSSSYRDEDFTDLICTHSVPVIVEDDEEKEIVCVIGLDFSLEWIDRIIEELKPFDDAYCILYSTDSTVIQASDNLEANGQLLGAKGESKNFIIQSAELSPMGMCLEIGVPKRRVWNSVRDKSLLTLSVLLIGIGLATVLIRRMMHDQVNLARAETANRLMEHELHIASEIQQSILREGERDKIIGKPWTDIDVEAMLIPMREVGGDLYDFHRRDDDFYFIIGDVSGKSVTAAMFMSATVNLFRSAIKRLQSPKSIMEEMNSVLSDNNPRMMFVTAFIGRLHIPTGELLFCNAGHLSPLKVHSEKTGQKVDSIEMEPNIPLGYDGGFRYKEQGTMLGKGDILVLYTDGVTEMRNGQRQMLGMKRWKAMISRHIRTISKDELEALVEDGERFLDKADLSDDLTLMFIRKLDEVKPLCIRIDNRIDQWPGLKTKIHDYALCAGMDTRTIKKIEVAVEEIVVNIVHYSQAEWIEIQCDKEPNNRVRIIIRDNGIPFDPTAQTAKEPEQAVAERQIGGLGIALVRQIADQMLYSRTDQTNVLTIIKNI